MSVSMCVLDIISQYVQSLSLATRYDLPMLSTLTSLELKCYKWHIQPNKLENAHKLKNLNLIKVSLV